MTMNLVRVMMDCARMIRIGGIGRGRKIEINECDLMFFLCFSVFILSHQYIAPVYTKNDEKN